MIRYLLYCFLLVGLNLKAICQEEFTVSSSHTRGYYEEAFDLKLAAPKAEIYYTLDGSLPNRETGHKFETPIPIETTSVVRSIAYSKKGDTSEVITHTYLFLEDVLSQPDSLAGWPMREVFTHYRGYPVLMDYAMDPAIVEDPIYRGDLIKGLMDLPSVMVTQPVDHFFKVHFSEDELPAYLEILYPDGEMDHEAAFAGIEGISHKLQKRSFRLSFKKKYGDKNFKSQVFKAYDLLNGSLATEKFDQLVLRGGTQRCWARKWYPDQTAYTRDQWYRDSQLATTGIGAHGTFVHFYVNGVYFGLYNLTERPDEKFMARYFKGKDDDFHSFNHNGTLSGEETRWDYLFDSLVTQDLQDPRYYAEFQAYLDVPAFFDYLLISWISGMGDWPINNYYGGYNAKEGSPLVFFGWDAEVTWENDPYEGHLGAWVHEYFVADAEPDSEIDELWHAGRRNPDFLMAFIDRVYLHCFNGGVLTDSAQKARWHYLNQYIENAIVAESARWGDALPDSITRTRDVHWRKEVARVDSLMDGNVDRFVTALRKEGYYPRIDPPQVSLGTDEALTTLKLKLSSEEEILYRLDGGDPREVGGKVAADAVSYTEPVACEPGSTLKVRTKKGDEWSALRVFVLP